MTRFAVEVATVTGAELLLDTVGIVVTVGRETVVTGVRKVVEGGREILVGEEVSDDTG